MYEALRDDGASKQKAARISNAASSMSRSTVGHKGGEAGSYDDMTKKVLLARARAIGIDGRSRMNNEALIKPPPDR